MFKDTISGAKAGRPGLSDALAFMREGDVLTVWKLTGSGDPAIRVRHASQWSLNSVSGTAIRTNTIQGR